MKRKQPKKPPPRWFDRADVELVAACTATIDGERAAKEQAHLEAIVGAFCASKDGPPTARFIWQKLEHFEDHRVRGRTRLAALAVEEQRHLGGRDHCGRHEPVPDRAADSREASDSVPREQVDADLERLFGAGWRGPKPSDCERASTWTAGVNGRTTQ